MITKIEALNYRCLRYISQELGNFHVLAGPNSSGKSTFLDTIALVADVVNKGPLEAIGDRASDYHDLFWMGRGDRFEIAIEARVPEKPRLPLEDRTYDRCRYELGIGTITESGELGIVNERLWLFKSKPTELRPLTLFPRLLVAPETIFWHGKSGRRTLINKVKGNDNFYSETGHWDHSFRLGPQKSALASVPEDIEKFPVSTWFKNAISESVLALTLNTRFMRPPSRPGLPRHLMPDGRNLPWVLHHLRQTNSDRLRDWVAHVRTALPDISDVDTIEKPEDKHRYVVLRYKNGLEIPSWLVSDGTLRFLALTLLPYLSDVGRTYMVEEPENGIHPKAIEAVHDSLSSLYEGQVLLATHSPIFLTLSDPSQVLCFAINEDGAADVIEGSRHPRLKNWRNEVVLGDLFAAGILA